MAFKYINPGYAGLLEKNSGAVKIHSSEYSRSGVAFYLNETSYGKGLLLENSPSEIYVAFDLYISDATGTAYIYIPGSYKTGFYFYKGTRYSTPYVSISLSSNNSSVISTGEKSGVNNILAATGIKIYDINSFLLHAEYGDNGLIELYVNSNLLLRKDTSISSSSFSTYSGVAFYSDRSSFFSNIIISDEYISPKERVIALPISQTITDMMAGASGIYIADAANQQLLQSVDVSSLIENYGASSAITGISLVGNPAYKTAEGLANLTALSKAGGSIAEHGTIALSGDSTAMIMDGWGLSSVTIADLQDMQFGWKVGE